jgi:hypothetical protein
VCSGEVLGDVEGFMVDSRDVEILDLRREGIGEVMAAGSCDDCADAVLLVDEEVLARVCGLVAASKLLMKMAPTEPLGSVMHWMSYSKVPSCFRIIIVFLL